MRLDASQSMHVTVRLFATLSRGQTGDRIIEVAPGTTVRQVVNRLKVPEDQVTLIFVNGRHAEPDRQLAEGDTVALFPPIGGG
jgi:molybdopterin synthase sulfur carrier subunit